ncbi:MAG: choice-of-anchor E domain-containing protein, partial [Caldilineaceae bacterium]|nr:choice-of-anchor E domain-containing protein [Caldilineaceae bacterium]
MMKYSHISFAGLIFLLLLVLGISLLHAPLVHAEERSYSDEIPIRRTDWTDTLSIPRFDPTLGILTKVEFVLVGKVNGVARLENMDAAPATVTAESVADVLLELPDGTFVAAASPRAAKSRDLAEFDGDLDFGGDSGTVIDNIVGIDISERVSYTDADSLAFFTGDGAIDMTIRTTSRSRATGSGNLALSFSTSAGAAITITYFIAHPAIQLEKATNLEDADQLPGPLLRPGEAVTWTYVVTNIGDVPLVDLTLVDDKEGIIIGDCPQNSLDIAESMVCTHDGTAQSGQYTNTATVTGDVPAIYPGEPRRVSDVDPSHYTG